jgi:glutamate 5-kinase
VRKAVAGANSEDVEAAREEYVRGLAPTQPGTPLATDIVGDASSMCQDLGSDETERMLPLQEGNAVLVEKGVVDDGQWEVEEVGRGLANYNSAQVDKVKGLNRCVPHSLALFLSPLLTTRVFSAYLSELLGYADTEYIVENVTIFVPP